MFARRLRRPWWSILLMIVMMLLLGAQCGGAQPVEEAAAPAASETEEAAAEPAEEAEAAPTEAVEEPAEAPTEEAAAAEPAESEGGKVVRISYTQELNSFNPLYTNQWFSLITTGLWLERPWNFDENAQPVPVHLTELPSLENGGISEDGLTITFKLKDGLTWSDGEPYTSEDWVFTWQMYMDEGNTVVSRYPYDEFVEEVTAPDPLTVVAKLTKPFPAWQSVLFVTANGGAILPKHILQPVFDQEGTLDNAEWNRAPSVGIGPFVFKEWESGSHFAFVPNPNYYGTAAKVDEIFFRILPDDAAQNAALKAGDADIGTFISFADIPDLKASGINILSASSGYNEGMFFNMRPDQSHPAMQDVNVRKAIAMGFNREQIVQDLLSGLTPVNMTFWDGSAWVNEGLEPYPYDPEAAKTLLDEAGWVDSNGDGTRDKDGEELVLNFGTTTRPVRKDAQAVIQQQLGEIGIGIELFNFEGDVFFAGYAEEGPCATGEMDICQWSNAASFPDPNTPIWLCSEIPSDEAPDGNNYFICDEALDKLFQEQAVEIDAAKRQEIMDQIQQIIYDNAYYIGMWNDADQWAVSPRLTGVKFSGVNPFFNAAEWDITE